MIVLTTPEPTVRPPSRNRVTVLFTIFSVIFLFFQHFCLLVIYVIFIGSIYGAEMEPLCQLSANARSELSIIYEQLSINHRILACGLHSHLRVMNCIIVFSIQKNIICSDTIIVHLHHQPVCWQITCSY